MRLIFFRRVALALAAGLLLPAAGPAQIVANQVDTFDGGTTQNWGGAPSLAVVPGGPTGSFLQVTATGSGAGGRLTVHNNMQWVGNYNAAGVIAIDMDVINLSATVLALRVSFKEDTSIASAGYVSTAAFNLPADNQWHHASFRLTDADMTAVPSSSGTPPAETFHDLLGSTARPTGPGELRILHSVAPNTVHGDFAGTNLWRWGIDNIRAVATPVPEPAGGLALLLAAAGLAGRRALRRRRVSA
jgi:hypothetical protein